MSGSPTYFISSAITSPAVTGRMTLSLSDCSGSVYKIVRSYRTNGEIEYLRIGMMIL